MKNQFPRLRLPGPFGIFGGLRARLSRARNAPRPLVVFGSSSSEVFDYIFGASPLYHPCWANGWSARSLRKERDADMIAACLRDLPPDTTILLNFGAADLNFNLKTRIRQERIYDLNGFLAEMVAGIVTARQQIGGLGFRSVWAVFPAPVIDLPQRYWNGFSLPPLPAVVQGQMYLDLAHKTAAAGVPVIGVPRKLIASRENPCLDPQFARMRPDHHASYIATQQIVWQAIAHLPYLPPPRAPFHTEHYPHETCMIGEWRKSGVPRHRTAW